MGIGQAINTLELPENESNAFLKSMVDERLQAFCKIIFLEVFSCLSFTGNICVLNYIVALPACDSAGG